MLYTAIRRAARRNEKKFFQIQKKNHLTHTTLWTVLNWSCRWNTLEAGKRTGVGLWKRPSQSVFKAEELPSFAFLPSVRAQLFGTLASVGWRRNQKFWIRSSKLELLRTFSHPTLSECTNAIEQFAWCKPFVRDTDFGRIWSYDYTLCSTQFCLQSDRFGSIWIKSFDVLLPYRSALSKDFAKESSVNRLNGHLDLKNHFQWTYKFRKLFKRISFQI